jgi:hypothetical protein
MLATDKRIDSDRVKAKSDILALFEREEKLDYFEIIAHLDIELEVVVKLCDELVAEGKLEEVEGPE